MLERRMLEQSWEQATPLHTYVAQTVENHELWVMTHKRAALTSDATARAAALRGEWKLLVLLADWCGDAVNSVPVIQRIADANPAITLRVLERDEHLALMDAHLTNGARAIPKVIVYDNEFTERGSWGSRPAPLQQWVQAEGLQLEKDARYKQVRTWYARDRGVTIANEMLTLLEQAATRAAPEAPGQVAGSNPL